MTIPVGYGQITHYFSGTGVPDGAVITYGIQNPTALSAATCALRAYDAWDTSNFDASYAAGTTMYQTKCKLGPDATGNFAFHVANTGGAGGAAGAAQVSTLVQKQTLTGGRKGRGRFFIPAVPEANVDPGGRLTAGTLATLEASGIAMLAALSADSIPMYLLHEDVTAPYEVTELVPSAFVATQRRRQPRV